MSTKKKLIISFTSLSLLLILCLATGLVLLAATRQNISSNISVSFIATDISGEVTAQYNLEGDVPVDMTTNGQADGSKVVKFVGSDTTQTMALNPQKTDLPLHKTKSLNFTYTFKNAGDAPYYVKVTYPVTTTNVGVMQVLNDDIHTDVTYGSDYIFPVPQSTSPTTLGILKFELQVSVLNAAKDASFSGEFKFNLAKTEEELDKRPIVKLVYEGLDAQGNIVPNTQSSTYVNSNVTLSNKITQYQVSDAVRESIVSNCKFVVPDTYNGLPVTRIKDNLFTDQYEAGTFCQIEYVKIGNNVKHIGSNAFNCCYYLKTVIIPNSVTSMGSNPFVYDTSLQCNIYNNIRYLGNLTNPYLYLVSPVSSSETTYTIHNNTKFIGNFNYCRALTSITFPQSVEYLSSSIFWDCKNLTTVKLSDNLKSIPSYAFKNCTSLKNLTIPDSVTSIGFDAFSNCTSLTNISIPNRVSEVGKGAFQGCNALQYNLYGNGKYLGNSTNPYLYLTQIENPSVNFCNIHKDTKVVENKLFSTSKNLTNITVGNGNSIYKSEGNCLLTKDGKTLVQGFNSSVIPNGVTTIAQDSFYGCSNLTNLIIPKSVTTIKSSAFYACNGLNIVIPITVTNIEDCAFNTGVVSCEATFRPEYWSKNFADGYDEYGGASVVWGDVLKGQATTPQNSYKLQIKRQYGDRGNVGNFKAVMVLTYATGEKIDIDIIGNQTFSHVIKMQLGANSPSSYLYYTMGGIQDVLANQGSGNPSEEVTLTANVDIIHCLWYQQCILAETEILMADGSRKALGDIVVGDEILSYDWETKKLIANPVIYASSQDTENKWTTIRYFVRTFDDGTVIKNAFAHRFYNVTQKGFIHLDFWKIGDEILKEDGTTAKLVSVEKVYEDCTFARITGKYGTNYFANGCLSGNSECPNNLDISALEKVVK